MNGIRITLSLAAIFGASSIYGASPVHNKVFEFVPAPGQFVNMLPEWEEGDDASTMANKALTCMQGNNENVGTMVSLGAWGGYVTVGFEKTIVNVEGKRDIYIEGNSFQASGSTISGGGVEPGVVLVSYDANQNGLPDDQWFEIAGSEYGNSIRDYEIVYYRPQTDGADIQWTDNKGNSGTIRKNPWHAQCYWPEWLRNEEKLVFTGTRLPDNAVNQGTAENPYYMMSRFDYGYADNYPNLDDSGNRNVGAMIDIDWAVDGNGNAVKLPGVDFVKIYTGVNQYNGWLGENSSEVCRVINMHTRMVGAEEVVDESIVMDESVLSDFLDKYGSVSMSRNDNLRIYLCGNGIVKFTLLSAELVQIFDQNGREVYSSFSPIGNNAISISDFPTGLYIVKVGNVCEKILKKR